MGQAEMPGAALVRQAEVIKVSGPMRIPFANDLLAQFSDLTASLQPEALAAVDLQQVTGVDASALAVLLAWRRQWHGPSLALIAAPAALVNLAQLHGVAELLGLPAGV